MTWSYSDPTQSMNDAVRFEVQDVFASSPLVQDEEISFAVAQETTNEPPYAMADIWRAAAHICEALSRRFAAQADSELGSLKLVYSKQSVGYVAMAMALRLRAQGSQAPYVGGQSVSEKIGREQDTDAVQPIFKRGQFNNPWSGQGQGYTSDDLGLFPEQ